MPALTNFITSYSPLRRNLEQSSEIGISAVDGGAGGDCGWWCCWRSWWCDGGSSGGESNDNAKLIEDESFKLPIVTVVATGERRSSKCCRVNAVVPSLTMQYGALTTVSKSLISNDKLFNYLDECLQGREREMVCGNKNCICLDIFLS